MSLFAKIFVAFGTFLVVVSGIYAVQAREYEGLVLSVSVTLGALLIGWYAVNRVVRARAQLIAGPVPPGSAADDEPHVRPTIWPMILAASTIGLVAGAAGVVWAYVPGGILFVVAAVGWIVDVQRQWRHHARPDVPEQRHGVTGGHPG